ncbi:hypothetical protein I8751_28900 [Nostocaceae cyanobacterium CENA357]|uniref:Uncharacterized protein n=1 Tax=Atlanticothrix silvestris CENA357 TaxID=1725252 RepID=A0A8J7HK26_9CYAN|nr:hypothetical protein [Atlanticothrix silvestris]MBH8556273.1 hypothetical protein [Atlanticothrix silvestris CENA357]
MSKCPRPFYTNKHSTQTLQQGLDEYYAVNPNLTNPKKLPPEFAKILLAHDVSHIIYGCDTGMYDELKLLPLIWWTSKYKFHDHLSTLQDSTISPVIRVMYDDLIKQHGVFWLYSSIFLVLPKLLPELIVMLWKNRQRQCYLPFLNFEPLLERSLLEIRQDFDLLPLIK